MCPVALVLAALLLAGLWQLVPLPLGCYVALAGHGARLYQRLLPSQPEILPFGETREAPVFPAGSTVSLYPGRTAQELMRLLAVFQEKRGFIALNLRTMAFTIGALVVILLGLGAIVVVPALLSLLPMAEVVQWLLWAARWPALVVIAVAAIALLYRYGPSREEARWSWLTPGSILAAVSWLAMSMLFSWYVGSFGSYNETYGSLGAVIGFMTWMWVSAIIVLVGAELNAEIEHQTARDTTIGQDKIGMEQPLGSGAPSWPTLSDKRKRSN